MGGLNKARVGNIQKFGHETAAPTQTDQKQTFRRSIKPLVAHRKFKLS
jgi:hypothetical protein